MTTTAVLIFPHQLFEDIKPIVQITKPYKKTVYYLIEHPLFFSDKERIKWLKPVDAPRLNENV
jgi:hypothetical protein